MMLVRTLLLVILFSAFIGLWVWAWEQAAATGVRCGGQAAAARWRADEWWG